MSKFDDYRVVDGKVERLENGRWQRVQRKHVLEIEVSSELWQHLRALGAKRPSPSGKLAPGQTSSTKRVRKPVLINLLPDELEQLDALAEAEGLARNAMVAKLVLEASKRR